MSATSTNIVRPPAPPGLVRWLKKNLFSTWYNALLTILAGAFIFFALKGIFQWVFFSANWGPVANSLKLFVVGQFPADQLWRVGSLVLLISFLLGLSWRVWGGTVRAFALTLAVFFGLVALLPVGSKMGLNIRLWFLVNPVLTFVGYQIGRTPVGKPRWIVLGWLLSLILTVIFLSGFEAVSWLWQIGTLALLISFLFGLSFRFRGSAARIFVLFLILSFAEMILLLIIIRNSEMSLSWKKLRLLSISLSLPEPQVWFWLVSTLILNFVGCLSRNTPIGKIYGVLLSWVFFAGLVGLHLTGFKGVSWLPPVQTELWGGLLLTFLLALVGIVASFPIGVMLALGRRSSLPVVKAFCVLFIELVRGVPLVTILFMASIILPLFLPEGVRIDRVLRAMIGMTLFAAAYMAENVRGGLQAIPEGQVEAAKAVGLNGFQTTLFIVLPQALRLVIPAIVGQFIALFMDTTLAVIVGLTELLAIGRAILESRVEWKLLQMEVFLFLAAIFWVFNFAMSYASRRLEVALGVGKR